MGNQTVGEWSYEFDKGYHQIKSEAVFRIATVGVFKDLEETKANAKLIALLKLLEGLRGMEAWIVDPEMKRHFQNKVYLAIKKATS